MGGKMWWRSRVRSGNLKSKIQNRKLVGIVALVVTLAMCGAAVNAHQQTKVPRIGYLTGATTDGQAARIESFRQGLRELGYVEGKNITVEYRYAEGKPERLAALAAEIVRLKVDVIVTGGGNITKVAKEATATIPIVMSQDTDPVGNGFVASLARPGANITGFATLAPELSGKRLELLKEVVPKLSRVAFFGNSNAPGNAQVLKETEIAAAAFGLQVQYLEVQTARRKTSPSTRHTAAPRKLNPHFKPRARGVLKHFSSSGTLSPRFTTHGSQSLR